MPRRRTPQTSLPRRLNRRRGRGNATDAQHRPRRGRPGQVEAIAKRRALALELRKAGGSYRAIAQRLGVDVHTVHGDVTAELADLRTTTVGRAEELRDLELHRLDQMTAGLWPPIRAGSPPAVTAAVRVSERRARLLGLDAPVVTKNELTGALSVTAERLAAERELFGKLDVHQLEVLAAESQALIDKAMAMVKSNAGTGADAAPEDSVSSDARGLTYFGTDVARSGNGAQPVADGAHTCRSLVLVGASSATVASVTDVATGETADKSTPPAVTDEEDAAHANPAARDTNADVGPNEPSSTRRQRGRVVQLLTPEKSN